MKMKTLHSKRAKQMGTLHSMLVPCQACFESLTDRSLYVLVASRPAHGSRGSHRMELERFLWRSQ